MSSPLTSYDPQLFENATSSPPKLVPFSAIESILQKLLSTHAGVESIFASQHRAFTGSTMQAREEGFSSSLPIQTAGQPPQPTLKAGEGAQVCIKTGYTRNGDVMVSKVAAGGGKASNTGAVFVYEQSSLRLRAVLCDEGLLTEVRTAAACAYASKMLLHKNIGKIQKIGIVGGGVQAVWQLRLLGAGVVVSPSSTSSCRRVVIKTTSRDTADAFIKKMELSNYPPDREWEFEHYVCPKDGGEGFRGCQLIHTLTPSRVPVIGLEDVKVRNDDGKEEKEEAGTFLHITAVGADSPGKTELAVDLIQRADALICDSIPQSKCRGEFQSSEFWDSLVEIGSVLKKGEQGENDNDNDEAKKSAFSIFDSSGLPLQDVEMANLISAHLE